jgi:hypothetical protein
MGVQFGSDRSPAATTTGGVVDQNGNAIISANNSFGQFPLGAAPLAQTLFGLPNGTFNLLPPVIGTAAEAEINNFDNPLPYWQVDTDESEGEVKSFIVYDETTNTTALRLTPGTAAGTSTYSVSTRSAVISDDNLALRQKAIATLEKVGTYAGTSQFYVKLDATYYDHAGSAISTQPIGTVYDNGTISSITGFTTAGTAAVGISAAYVDLKFSLVTTQAVTSGISVDINTLLLQTSQGGGGGASSFLVTETFTSSTTWTPPTGVDTLVAVVAVGGGGGGDGGVSQVIKGPTTAAGTVIAVADATGGIYRAGNSGRWAYATNLYVGTASISIGVGAGGAGGAGGTANKPAGTTTTPVIGTALNGGGGSGSTFGTYITAYGGGNDSNLAALETIVYGVVGTASLGGISASDSPSGTADTSAHGGAGTAAFGTVITVVPFTTGAIAGGAGGSATYSKSGTANTNQSTSIRAGGTASAAGLLGGGGGSGAAKVVGVGTAFSPTVLRSSTGTAGIAGVNNSGGAGGGSGAAAVQGTALTGGTVTIAVTGGAGGTAGYYGSGGGAGGQAVILCGNSAFYDRSILTATGGAGGAGAGGFVIIAYIA